jgi:hypothetical protein
VDLVVERDVRECRTISWHTLVFFDAALHINEAFIRDSAKILLLWEAIPKFKSSLKDLLLKPRDHSVKFASEKGTRQESLLKNEGRGCGNRPTYLREKNVGITEIIGCNHSAIAIPFCWAIFSRAAAIHSISLQSGPILLSKAAVPWQEERLENQSRLWSALGRIATSLTRLDSHIWVARRAHTIDENVGSFWFTDWSFQFALLFRLN